MLSKAHSVAGRLKGADIAVIGAGVIGLFTALALRRAGASVTVYERGQPFREASWAGAGVLFPMHPWRYPEAVWREVRASLDHYRALDRTAAAIGERIGLRRDVACLLGDTAAAVEWCRMHGQPHAVSDGGAAVRIDNVWQVRNPWLGRALLRILSRQGVQFVTDVGVAALRLHADGAVVLGPEGQARGFDQVVVCAGVSTDRVLAGAGLSRVGVSATKGQMLLLDDAAVSVTEIRIGPQVYAVPRGDGRLLLGATEEPSVDDPRPTPQARQWLLQQGEQLGIDGSRCPVLAQWAGLRPTRDEGLPWVGRHPQAPQVWVNAGHFRHGLSMAPASAEALCRQMCAGE